MDGSGSGPEGSKKHLAGLERWGRPHPNGVALLLVLVGLAARLSALRGEFLNPDELLQLQIARSPRLLDVYRASLSVAHPPLFLFLLHWWRRFATHEWLWRLPPILFGTAFLWSAYRWASSAFGRAAALSTLALLALLPSLVLLSIELRPYTLLLWLTAAALVSLERALARERAGNLVFFGLFSGLALLTHYSALLFLPGACLYLAIRFFRERHPARLVWVGIGTTVLLAALVFFLFESHLAHLVGGALEKEAKEIWLRSSYFHGGEESVLLFALRQTLALFTGIFSTKLGGVLGLFLLLAGIAWLAQRRRPESVLLALPLGLCLLAGLLGLYPFGGTRHSSELALFVGAGVGVALAALSRDRLWPAMGVAALLAPAAFLLRG